MVAGKALLDYTEPFSSKNYQKNDKVTYKYFNDTYGKRKHKPWFSAKNMWKKKIFLRRKKKRFSERNA